MVGVSPALSCTLSVHVSARRWGDCDSAELVAGLVCVSGRETTYCCSYQSLYDWIGCSERRASDFSSLPSERMVVGMGMWLSRIMFTSYDAAYNKEGCLGTLLFL